MAEARVVEWQNLPAQTAPSGAKKCAIEGKGADLVRVEIKAGARAERHSHPHEQFVQVIEGTGTLETATGTCTFTAGSVFHFPAHAWHAATFVTDTVLVETNLSARE